MADPHFPICISCGMRGSGVRWYHVSPGGRFGECARCQIARKHAEKRQNYLDESGNGSGPWVV